MKKRYSLYVRYLRNTTNLIAVFQSSDNYKELLIEWVTKIVIMKNFTD
jgi:hypothetical protein